MNKVTNLKLRRLAVPVCSVLLLGGALVQAEDKSTMDREREATATSGFDQSAQSNESATTRKEGVTNYSLNVVAASDLLGEKVSNESGENLGKISDLGIDLEDGNVAFVVLESGATLGMGGTHYRVPLNQLHKAPDGKHFTLNAKKDELESEFARFEPQSEGSHSEATRQDTQQDRTSQDRDVSDQTTQDRSAADRDMSDQ